MVGVCDLQASRCFRIAGLHNVNLKGHNVETWGLFLESPEKPFIKLRLAYSVKLVFSYVVKGIKIKITAKFRASRPLTFEDTKRIMSPEMRPKSFGTFEKQAPDQLYCTIISWLRGFSPVHCLSAQVYKIHRYGGNVILVGFISFGLRPVVI